jgi:uncharacterized protein YdeI (YjbR/CyaY-like superfamily)
MLPDTLPIQLKSAIHFPSAGDFRGWLEKHHASATEAMVRLRKVGTVGAGITYAEALDQALCFGWIDGVRLPFDDAWYLTRFSPRKHRSTWSLVNLRHFERLNKLGLIAPAGRAAFDRRDPARTGVYSFEKRPERFPPKYEMAFRAKSAAWGFFEKQPPGYRRLGIHWVISAKQEETRQRRLAMLIANSAAGRRIV